MVSDEAQFESPEQLAEAAAAALAEASAQQAFKLFQNKEYRRSARFDALDQVEQDRIFNELVVAHLVLIMLILEAPDLRVAPEFRDHLITLKELIPKAYVDNLKTLGVEDEHLRVWDKLISLRYEEYAKDRLGVAPPRCTLRRRRSPWSWTIFPGYSCSSPFKRWPSAAITMSAGVKQTAAMSCSSWC